MEGMGAANGRNEAFAGTGTKISLNYRPTAPAGGPAVRDAQVHGWQVQPANSHFRGRGAEILSADLSLRFLPQIIFALQNADPEDTLIKMLENILQLKVNLMKKVINVIFNFMLNNL